VPAATMRLWRQRMGTPVNQLVQGPTNNWRTYAMRGEWLRARMGLSPHDEAVAFIEDTWRNTTQRERIAADRWNLYQDHQTDPESHAVEAVGRVNLLGLVEHGYDGASAEEIRRLAERGTAVSLLLQDPSGQCPPDGRTDDHVFNDVLYQLAFEAMAERAGRRGDLALAGQYRHAAMLSFQSLARWRRRDEPWAGSYYVTKNRFDPAERVGYQAASNYGNYNGAVMIHLAEAYLARRTDFAEVPAPVEIGGYAFATDPKFASAVANAGGMQMFAALRGDTRKLYDRYWTALGVERFARVGWETRLGPSDGIRDVGTNRGVTFAPTWNEAGRWVRLADVPERYQGEFQVQFAHPLLVRCAIEYRPVAGAGAGPSFRHEFVLTPDGVLATLRSADAVEFGTTWPILEDDGTPLLTTIGDHSATTAYAADEDEQWFLALDPDTAVTREDDRVRSTYGWLRPVRATAAGRVSHTFVYPRGPGDPAAEAVRRSFRLTDDAGGFDSVLGSVHGTLYVGRHAAGGEGGSIDCDSDGRADGVFDPPCRFVLQLRDGHISAVEADRRTTFRWNGRSLPLEAFVAATLDRDSTRRQP
jgi:hypothetical protein